VGGGGTNELIHCKEGHFFHKNPSNVLKSFFPGQKNEKNGSQKTEI
jgi:hypothetical protein